MHIRMEVKRARAHVCVCVPVFCQPYSFLVMQFAANKKRSICTVSLAQLRFDELAVGNFVVGSGVSTNKVDWLNISSAEDKIVTLQHTFSSVLHFNDHSPNDNWKTKA